jgi:hypothetical protein
MGLNARRALEQQWCQEKAFAQWRDALLSLEPIGPAHVGSSIS